jgi:[acyl-carrier-protein] S-malonyltransferase
MNAAATAFSKKLADVDFSFSGSSVLAGVSGENVFTRDQAVAALTAQIHQTIDWHACLETAFSYGNRIFLELGPGHGLARMALEAFHGIEARSLSEFRDLYAVEKWIKAVSAREYEN